MAKQETTTSLPTPETDAQDTRGEVAEIMQSRLTRLPMPANYAPPTHFPTFDVVRINNGAGSAAPDLGEKFSFASEDEARAYIDYVGQTSFKGTVQLTQWETSRKGKILEDEIEIG